MNRWSPGNGFINLRCPFLFYAAGRSVADSKWSRPPVVFHDITSRSPATPGAENLIACAWVVLGI